MADWYLNATVLPSQFIPVLPPVHQPGGTWMNLVSTGMNRDARDQLGQTLNNLG